MSRTDEDLDGKHQRLKPQDHGMHDADRIYGVQHQPLRSSQPGVMKQGMIVSVGIGQTATSRGYPIKATLVEGLQVDCEGPWPGDLLHIDKLLSRPHLARCHVVLNACDDHRYDGQWLGYAGRLGNHSRLDHLGLDLPEARD